MPATGHVSEHAATHRDDGVGDELTGPMIGGAAPAAHREGGHGLGVEDLRRGAEIAREGAVAQRDDGIVLAQEQRLWSAIPGELPEALLQRKDRAVSGAPKPECLQRVVQVAGSIRSASSSRSR